MKEQDHEGTPPKFLTRAALATVAALLLTPPAHAQQARVCNQRDAALKHLSKKYAEEPVALGLANNGGVLEVLATPDGTGWTILITMPNGRSCMIASGEAWMNLPPPLKGDES